MYVPKYSNVPNIKTESDFIPAQHKNFVSAGRPKSPSEGNIPQANGNVKEENLRAQMCPSPIIHV